MHPLVRKDINMFTTKFSKCRANAATVQLADNLDTARRGIESGRMSRKTVQAVALEIRALLTDPAPVLARTTTLQHLCEALEQRVHRIAENPAEHVCAADAKEVNEAIDEVVSEIRERG